MSNTLFIVRKVRAEFVGRFLESGKNFEVPILRTFQSFVLWKIKSKYYLALKHIYFDKVIVVFLNFSKLNT